MKEKGVMKVDGCDSHGRSNSDGHIVKSVSEILDDHDVVKHIFE